MGGASPQGKTGREKALKGAFFGRSIVHMKYVVSCALVLALSGCGGQGPGFLRGGLMPDLRPGAGGTAAGTTADPEVAPESVTDGDPLDGGITAPPPAENAVTVEQFDTTTPEDRAAALETPPKAEDGRLGTTVASLGDPGEAGFWVKTPLVTEVTSGRIVYVTSGRSVQVELRPSGGPAGGGSQVSLPAMRLLDAPLAGLPELVVYQNS